MMKVLIGTFLIMLLGVAYYTQNSPPTSQSSAMHADTGPIVLTKDEWLQKASTLGNQGALVRFGQIQASKADLYRTVGNPTSTQTFGNEVTLYWDCRDGQIQVVANLSGINLAGIISGSINTY